uniref:Uncharacterized protein n=1 Tax=Timema genevievae TaxID=629358 RepID=A0A7R9K673_TIMGE|nr:unnamed protein product [Timema genevievae]
MVSEVNMNVFALQTSINFEANDLSDQWKRYNLKSNGLFLWLPEIFNNLSKFSFVHPEEPASICLAYAQPNDMFGVAAASNITNYDVSSSTQYSMDTLNTTSACSSSITPETFQNTIIVGTASGAMYFVAGYLIDIIGKKTMLAGKLVGRSHMTHEVILRKSETVLAPTPAHSVGSITMEGR